jgi:hypothetical protein
MDALSFVNGKTAARHHRSTYLLSPQSLVLMNPMNRNTAAQQHLLTQQTQ